ncbi:MAG TPA: nuclear transport factor 2 family protein [Steroidobacteraceae bacterium]
MKPAALMISVVLLTLMAVAHAQVPPVASPDQLSMLRSDDPALARNKRLVFDFWRIVFEGGHMDRAPEFMTESYIQHNPNVTSGRAAFIATIGKVRKPKPIAPLIKVPVVAITADRDIVTVATARRVRDSRRPDHIYYMTWFDMFRIENGKIAEHWDSSPLWEDGRPLGAEFLP